MGEVENTDSAIQIAKEYAAEECVGQFGEILDASEENNGWAVEFRTHTYSDTYDHRLRLNRVGNVFSHERGDRIE